MRVKKITLGTFKGFDGLTVDLQDRVPKLVALIGPNGCGKSSIFDAFATEQRRVRPSTDEPELFYIKHYGGDAPKQNVGRFDFVKVETDQPELLQNSFYIRTAFRFTPKLDFQGVQTQPDIITHGHPGSSITVDNRITQNYSRLWSTFFNKVRKEKTKTGEQIDLELLGELNQRLQNVFNFKISSLGDLDKPETSTLQFEKGNSRDFPYSFLSAGEKEGLDLILDIFLKRNHFNNTVFCIDEPELHLHTHAQRKLLVEIERMLPDSCQLWVATHSTGCIRALQDELKTKSEVLEFSGRESSGGSHQIFPIQRHRNDWQRIFVTALDDLAYLVAPKRMIYCEGDPIPGSQMKDMGLDAEIYNTIFNGEFPETLFISAGGNQVAQNASVALSVLNKAFAGVDLWILKDKDGRTSQLRQDFLNRDPRHRMLDRHELENYVFDEEILKTYCLNEGHTFDQNRYQVAISKLVNDDYKPLHQQIKQTVGYAGTIPDLKKKLAKHVTPNTACYAALKKCIF